MIRRPFARSSRRRTFESLESRMVLASTVPSVTYNASTGEVDITSPVALDSITLLSETGVFSGAPASSVGDFPSVDTNHRISIYDTVGFESIRLGPVAPGNLASAFLQDDLNIHARALDGTVYDVVRLIRVVDAEVVLAYDPVSGELDAAAERPMTALQLESTAGIFSAVRPEIFTDGFDVYRPEKLFKFASRGLSTMDFGPAVQANLAIDFIRNDLVITSTSLTRPLEFTQFHIAPVLRPDVLTSSPPVAHAGLPYIMNEGEVLALDATTSFDLEGAPLNYSWDLNGDGEFDDATGASPSVVWGDLLALYPGGIGANVTLTVRVDDGVSSSTDSVQLTINNVAPSIESISNLPTQEPGIVVTFAAVASDPGNDPLTYSWTFGDGTNQIVGNAARVAHVFDRIGEYTVTLRVDDGDGGQDTASTQITIAAIDLPNLAPIAVDDVVELPTDQVTEVSSELLSNDSDPNGDVLVISGASGFSLQGAALSLVDGTLQYDPTTSEIIRSLPATLAIRDSFTYDVANSGQLTATATVTATIIGVNDTPVANDDTLSLQENAGRVEITATLLANDSDFDIGDTIAVSSVVADGLVGSLQIDAGRVFYNPDPGFNALAAGETATETFRYEIMDSHGATATASATLTIIGETDIPGDFNRDGNVELADVDLLCAAISGGGFDPVYDVDGSGVVSIADLDELIVNVLGTAIGDANLDGIFDSSDLVQVFAAGEYEDRLENNSRWATGDWNCDREFDTSDLVRAFQFGGYVAAARPTHDVATAAAIVGAVNPQGAASKFEPHASHAPALDGQPSQSATLDFVARDLVFGEASLLDANHSTNSGVLSASVVEALGGAFTLP